MTDENNPKNATKHCLTCGYVLDGLVDARCPECGRGFSLLDARTYAKGCAEGVPVRSGQVFLLGAVGGLLSVGSIFPVGMVLPGLGLSPTTIQWVIGCQYALGVAIEYAVLVFGACAMATRRFNYTHSLTVAMVVAAFAAFVLSLFALVSGLF